MGFRVLSVAPTAIPTTKAEDFAADVGRANGKRRVSPRTLATLVQAILHGLAMQRAADPDAYEKEEMLDLCVELLGNYVKRRPSSSGSQWTTRKRINHE